MHVEDPYSQIWAQMCLYMYIPDPLLLVNQKVSAVNISQASASRTSYLHLTISV